MPTRNICGEKCTTVSRVLVRDSKLQGMWLLSLHKATEIIIIKNYVWVLATTGWKRGKSKMYVIGIIEIILRCTQFFYRILNQMQKYFLM